MIRALILDFDGLILDTETPLIDSYADVHLAHGVPFNRELLVRNVGHADFAFDPWHGFSPHADRAALETERRALKNARILRQPVLPGVVELLAAARTRNLRVGLASNSEHRWCDPHLARLGLREYFEFLACREDAPSPKPEPDLYKLVLQRFGLRGHEAIAFEDSQTGVRAARRANLWVVAVPQGPTVDHDMSHAHLRVGSLAEIDLEALIAQFEKPHPAG